MSPRLGTVLLILLCLLQGSIAAAADLKRPLAACVTGYHTTYDSQSVYSTVATPGQTIRVNVYLWNNGCNTWNKNTSSEARLGTVNPQPGQDQPSPLCVSGLFGWEQSTFCNRIEQEAQTVAYNQLGVFAFDLRAPAIEGVYRIYLAGVIDGCCWMENHGVFVEVKVGNYYGVQNAAFKKPSGANILTQQSTCIYCVPAATSAWISYVWIQLNGNDAGHDFTHADLFNNYFGVTTQANSRNTGVWPYTLDDPQTIWSGCSGLLGGNFPYQKRAINTSSDGGVDPYGAAWGTFTFTPGGNYYNAHVWSSSVNDHWLARDYATRGIAITLSRFDEPVGVLIDNGTHYVLATGVISDRDPQVDFWGAVIGNIYVRDPIRDVGEQLRVFQHNSTTWNNTFTPYGFAGEDPTTHPRNCTAPQCIDDARTGYGTYTLDSDDPTAWWGRYVTVQRAISNQQQTPDTIWTHVR